MGTAPAQQTAKQQDATWSFVAASGAGLTREGYSFLGWAENPTAASAEYQAGDTISLTQTDPQKTLYAVWKATGPFNGLTTMQGMTSDACKNAKYGETARLEDTRDGKKYWVTKLADGNCWMTQNLDFDIPEEGISIADGSNIDWNPKNPTKTGALTNNSSSENTNSWDQGFYVYSTPIASTSCGTGLVAGISSCAPGGSGAIQTFIKVGSGYTPSDDPDFTKKNNNKSVNTDTRVYDAHYLIGNYYSYNAATAGTGASVSTEGANATSSICPKGWELPSAGATHNDENSFYRLLTAQGMTGIVSLDNGNASLASTVTVKTVSYDQNGSPIESSSSMRIGEALTTAPLFFVRGGYVYYGDNTLLWLAGERSWYWSRSPDTINPSFARNLYFDNSHVLPSYANGRYLGLSLRCLYSSAL